MKIISLLRLRFFFTQYISFWVYLGCKRRAVLLFFWTMEQLLIRIIQYWQQPREDILLQELNGNEHNWKIYSDALIKRKKKQELTALIHFQDYDEIMKRIRFISEKSLFKRALKRGIGFHHSGCSANKRSVVEMLFRGKYLQVRFHYRYVKYQKRHMFHIRGLTKSPWLSTFSPK